MKFLSYAFSMFIFFNSPCIQAMEFVRGALTVVTGWLGTADSEDEQKDLSPVVVNHDRPVVPARSCDLSKLSQQVLRAYGLPVTTDYKNLLNLVIKKEVLPTFEEGTWYNNDKEQREWLTSPVSAKSLSGYAIRLEKILIVQIEVGGDRYERIIPPIASLMSDLQDLLAKRSKAGGENIGRLIHTLRAEGLLRDVPEKYEVFALGERDSDLV